MGRELNGLARSDTSGAFEAALEEEIDHLKNLLLEHDRSLSQRLSATEKPSLEERKARSRIIRQLNRTRRQLYRLRTGIERQPTKKISFRIDEEDYAHLRALAQQEGLSLSAYIRKRLFPEK